MNREYRLIFLSIFTFSFFIVELVVGYASGSIALIADSFHMLSDVASVIVSLYALRLAKNSTAGPKFTYGLQRAEVLGALINSVSLITLCVTILFEAIQRLFEPVHIEKPIMVIAVGSVGLLFNLIGMGLFHEHAHHHDHSHSHGHGYSHGHPHKCSEDHDHLHQDYVSNSNTIQDELDDLESPNGHERESSAGLELFPTTAIGVEIISTAERVKNEGKKASSQAAPKEGHLNDHSVFLHILGDALGSFGVIVSSLIVLFVKDDWKYYADPVMSILITFMIFFSTMPLVKSASKILLLGAPTSIRFQDLKSEISNVPGVVGVHELHIWQLSDTKSVCSVHVVLREPKPGQHVLTSYREISEKIKKTLHTHGIHSTTVQTEYEDTNATFPHDEVISPDEYSCLMTCESNSCKTQVCCPTDMK